MCRKSIKGFQLIEMANFTTVERLEKETGHKHDFKFYDNYPETFDYMIERKERNPLNPIGTVWECKCGAREIRFIVWTGEHDKRAVGS
jgi:hypothetical protein